MTTPISADSPAVPMTGAQASYLKTLSEPASTSSCVATSPR